MLIIGIDIGGTKSATVIAEVKEENVVLFKSRIEFLTLKTPKKTIEQLIFNIENQLKELKISIDEVEKIGISCGGPLDVERRLIMSPPNLPGWDNVPICDIFEEKFNKKTFLMNDADAGAVAEWKYGVAQGYNNVIFITFGTGLGSGLILNGQLYSGGSGMAGEIGHVRLTDGGPVGYGKNGSFEGYCSGAGIQQQINWLIAAKKQEGIYKEWFNKKVNTKKIFELAKNGDDIAIEFINKVSYNFGRGLAILIDILNPDIIVVGGIFMRNHELFKQYMNKSLKEECLTANLKHVKILPAKLGEKIGDYASICAALNGKE